MIQTLHDRLFIDHGITAGVLRLDRIHPEISGNKWFKLKYHLADALSKGMTGLVSFGGAYSNHLVAMAFICRTRGLKATAVIRGDDPIMFNPSLKQMREFGMEIVFVSREAYKNKQALMQEYLSGHPGYYYVPEGGQSELGVNGASEIMLLANTRYTDIICAVGTGTTIAGIIRGTGPSQQVTGICSLKVADKNENVLLDFIKTNTEKSNYKILFDYHFGGYAKKNHELIGFMNELHLKEHIPTDFVYTGKLFYAVYDLVRKKFFPEGSKLLVIHSGGLQGNRALPEGVLEF